MDWSRWFPPQTDMPPRSALVAAAFALVGIALTALVGQWVLGGRDAVFLAASMGAASVLLFIVPSSPMSTPWALVGGHLISVAIGITSYRLLQDPLLAAPLAVAGSIVAMYALRCLHPPGGAATLLSVLGGEPVHQLGYQFLLTPIGVNVAVMLAMLLLYRRYLRRQETEEDLWLEETATAQQEAPFEEEDLALALAQSGQFVDVTHEELMAIYRRAQAHALSRRLGAYRCRDLAEAPVAVEYATPLGEVWRLFKEKDLCAIPVVDRVGHVQGMVTRSEFLRHAARWGDGDQAAGIRRLCRPSGKLESERPEAAGQIITRSVPLAPQDDPAQPWVETVQRLGHDLPVVDERKRLRGLITLRSLQRPTTKTPPTPGKDLQ